MNSQGRHSCEEYKVCGQKCILPPTHRNQCIVYYTNIFLNIEQWYSHTCIHIKHAWPALRPRFSQLTTACHSGDGGRPIVGKDPGVQRMGRNVHPLPGWRKRWCAGTANRSLHDKCLWPANAKSACDELGFFGRWLCYIHLSLTSLGPKPQTPLKTARQKLLSELGGLKETWAI